MGLDILTLMSLPTSGSLPSLFHVDGLTRKPSNEADLAYILEKDIMSSSTWPIASQEKCSSIVAIDLSVLVKKLVAVHNHKTFNNKGCFLIEHLNFSILSVSCDDNDDIDNVKEYERKMRASENYNSFKKL